MKTQYSDEELKVIERRFNLLISIKRIQVAANVNWPGENFYEGLYIAIDHYTPYVIVSEVIIFCRAWEDKLEEFEKAVIGL